MENINDMRKRHEKEIGDLQKNCRHEELIDPIKNIAGLKVCTFCGKIIKDNYKYKIINGLGKFIEV